jgi:Xaa-Pro aminopeptidase
MKRGLISWDTNELPPEELATRLATVQVVLRTRDVDALVVYSDVWRSNDVRYLSNYMPYWNRAFAVVPRDEPPILLCSLSPRVYPWIKSVTVHETIVASPSLPAALLKLCTERGWTHVGVCDLDGLPADLHTQLLSGKVRITDIPRGEIRPGPTEVEVQMHARAADLARTVLTAALETALPTVGKLTDHELTGRLERLLRRAGAEDAVILVSDGNGPPVPASGAAVGKHTSVVVAVEHNGHWAKVTRNLAGVTATLPPASDVGTLRETLSGPYSWQSLDSSGGPAAVVSLQVEIIEPNHRLYYGETCLQSEQGLRTL